MHKIMYSIPKLVKTGRWDCCLCGLRHFRNQIYVNTIVFSIISWFSCVCLCLCMCVWVWFHYWWVMIMCARSVLFYVCYSSEDVVRLLSTHYSLLCWMFSGVLNFVPMDGPTFGNIVTSSPHLAGINFTGSAE